MIGKRNLGGTALLLALLLGGGLFSIFAAGKEDCISAFNRSIELEKNGKYAEAMTVLRSDCLAMRSDYLINLRTGWLFYLNSKPDSSEFYYRRALGFSGAQNVEARLGLVYPLAAEGKWNEVENEYREILSLDPNHYTANLRLGQIELNRGDFANAKTRLSALRLRYPADYEANLSLGWSHLSLGEKGSARSCFERVLMISENDSSALRGMEQLR